MSPNNSPDPEQETQESNPVPEGEFSDPVDGPNFGDGPEAESPVESDPEDPE